MHRIEEAYMAGFLSKIAQVLTGEAIGAVPPRARYKDTAPPQAVAVEPDPEATGRWIAPRMSAPSAIRR